MTEFMNRASRYGIIVLFLGIFLDQFCKNHDILQFNMVIDLLYLIGLPLTGFDMGQKVGESKNCRG